MEIVNCLDLPNQQLISKRANYNSRWGADTKTLRIAALSLLYFTSEYCASVWYRSAHTRLIEIVLNDALHIVTVCLCPTPTNCLPILAGISQLSFADKTTT